MTEREPVDRWLWVRDADPVQALDPPAEVEADGTVPLDTRLPVPPSSPPAAPPAQPDMAEVLANKIAGAAARKDYAKLSEYGEELLKLHRQSPVALEALMLAEMARADYKAASQHGARLVKCARQSEPAWFNLGFCFHKLNRIEEAAQAYTEAIKLQGDGTLARVNLAVIMQQLDDIGGARRELEYVREREPDNAFALWNLALLHEKEGHPERAEMLYLRLIGNGHNIAQTVFRLGWVRFQQCNFPGAAEAFERCLLEQPDWPAGLLNLSLAQWRSGDHESATATLELALSKDPNFVEALRLGAALAIQSGDWGKAASLETRLAELGENTSELVYNIGVLQQRASRWDEAIVSYRSALKQDSGFTAASLNLGHALSARGENADARSVWQAALHAEPALADSYFKPVLARSAACPAASLS